MQQHITKQNNNVALFQNDPISLKLFYTFFPFKLYLLFISCLIILFVYLFVRFKYKVNHPFWYIQPVFHYHDLSFWFSQYYIINNSKPTINHYYNSTNIVTTNFEHASKHNVNSFISTIQLHYFNNFVSNRFSSNKYYPTSNNILPYLQSHNYPSFFTVYYNDKLFNSFFKGTMTKIKKPVAFITSKPVIIKQPHQTNENKHFMAYYVDYLCVQKQFRKKNIASELIQTHEYNQSHMQNNTLISVFKREDELTSIMPITVFKSFCYSIKGINTSNSQNKSNILANSVILLNKDNISTMFDFLQKNEHKFKFIMHNDYSNLLHLLNTSNIFITVYINEEINECESMYIFKKTCTYIDDGDEIFSCIGSIKQTKLDNDMFVELFKISVEKLKINNLSFEYLMIDDISENNVLIRNMDESRLISEMKNAYYYYNYVSPSIKSSECLIVL